MKSLHEGSVAWAFFRVELNFSRIVSIFVVTTACYIKHKTWLCAIKLVMNIMFILTEKSTCSNKVRKFVSVLKLTQMVIIIAFFGPARKRPAFKTNVWCSVTSFYRNILNDQQHFQMKKNSMDAFITRNVFISANNYVISIILVAVGLPDLIIL